MFHIRSFCSINIQTFTIRPNINKTLEVLLDLKCAEVSNVMYPVFVTYFCVLVESTCLSVVHKLIIHTACGEQSFTKKTIL